MHSLLLLLELYPETNAFRFHSLSQGFTKVIGGTLHQDDRKNLSRRKLSAVDPAKRMLDLRKTGALR
jgi:hypothetical protein